MKKIKICLKNNNNIFPLFLIGYYKDGGFFIKDLIKNNGENYIISKISIPRNLKPAEETFCRFNRKNTWETNFIKPKLSHHGKGFAQISETGLRSGVFKTLGFFKGVAMKSINLFLHNNDGGPLYVFNMWGLDNMQYEESLDEEVENVILNDADFTTTKNHEKNSYILEFFHLPIQAKGHIDKDGYIWLCWKGYGNYIAKYIPEYEHSPGFLAVSCKKDSLGPGFKNWPYGLSMGGCPGFPRLFDLYRSYKQIGIIYPEKFFGKKIDAKNLRFTKFWHMISIVDKKFYNLFH